MSGQELTDEEVIKLVLAGEREAYGIIVERYQKVIFNLMYRMCGSIEEASDLTQDVFVKAYEKLASFKEGKRFFPWLYAIGINRAKNFLRDSKVRATVSVDNFERQTSSTHILHEEDKICNRLDIQRVYKALQEIPYEYREAVILRYREGCSLQDIADALGISLSAAKMRVYRGLEKLKELIS